MITKVLINEMHEPIGYDFQTITIHTLFEEVDERDIYDIKIEYNETVKCYSAISILDNKKEIDIDLIAKTRYIITVTQSDNKFETFFETGLLNEGFTGSWIDGRKDIQNNIFKKEFRVDGEVSKTRLYIASKGIYEAYINGQKVGDEYLAPGFTKYDSWVQVQTYDVSEYLNEGENQIAVSVGDGWYKSRIGFDGGHANVYGDIHGIICDLEITQEEGNSLQVISDDTWDVYSGKVTKSGIYYGEDIDDTINDTYLGKAQIGLEYETCDRWSLPVKSVEKIYPKRAYVAPNGELVVDFGQNHSGLIVFTNKLPAGREVMLECSEFVEHDNFYRENMNTARAALKYKSNGEKKLIRPHFTYYGFQYLRISGITIDELELLDDLHSAVIYSNIDFHSTIETSNEKVNKLISNIIWGQKSNFVDIPTDCPQRDERLGWTGDANIFSKTAGINANVLQFFKKYMKDIRVEQDLQDGLVPDYAPLLHNRPNESAIWGDAITFIPYNLFLLTGDVEILRQNYNNMIDWIKWIEPYAEDNIWRNCYQYGDWLGLDATNQDARYGGTDETYVATIYYYMSVDIIVKVGTVLDKDVSEFKVLRNNIKDAIINEYVSGCGALTIDTQSAYLLMLNAQILDTDREKRVVTDLVHKIRSDRTLLQTGFAGTPLICKILSKYGHHDIAMQIFMHEGYPGWLYSVNMGATTIWERWNSVLPDGTINRTGMNSLNHYSYGAILEWMYEYLLGVKQIGAGAKQYEFTPGVQGYITKINAEVMTQYGPMKCGWQLNDMLCNITLNIPVGVNVKLRLERKSFAVNGKEYNDDFDLTSGSWNIEYTVSEKLSKKMKLNMNSPVYEVMLDKEKWDAVQKFCPYYLKLFEDGQVRKKFGKYSIQKYIQVHNITLSKEQLLEMQEILER